MTWAAVRWSAMLGWSGSFTGEVCYGARILRCLKARSRDALESGNAGMAMESGGDKNAGRFDDGRGEVSDNARLLNASWWSLAKRPGGPSKAGRTSPEMVDSGTTAENSFRKTRLPEKSGNNGSENARLSVSG